MNQETTDDAGLMFRSDAHRKPSFFADADVGRLLAVINTLASEVAVLRARLDTHERLAARKQVFDRGEVEAFEPSAEEFAQRQADNHSMIARLYRPLSSELSALAADEAAIAALIARTQSPRS